MKLDTLGRHILVEYYNCNEDILKDHKKIEELLNEAAVLFGAMIVTSTFHHFNPWGVSGAVIISESHLTIHTWPEFGYAAVDLFTCGDKVDPWIGFEFLEKALEAGKSESYELSRGNTDKIKRHNPAITGDISFKMEETGDVQERSVV